MLNGRPRLREALRRASRRTGAGGCVSPSLALAHRVAIAQGRLRISRSQGKETSYGRMRSKCQLEVAPYLATRLASKLRQAQPCLRLTSAGACQLPNSQIVQLTRSRLFTIGGYSQENNFFKSNLYIQVLNSIIEYRSHIDGFYAIRNYQPVLMNVIVLPERVL
jgi:hypothetical protein